MIEILNLAVPHFGLIFIGFACGKPGGAGSGSRLIAATLGTMIAFVMAMAIGHLA